MPKRCVAIEPADTPIGRSGRSAECQPQNANQRRMVKPISATDEKAALSSWQAVAQGQPQLIQMQPRHGGKHVATNGNGPVTRTGRSLWPVSQPVTVESSHERAGAS